MSFKAQIVASFIGTFFGFVFAIVLFFITNFIQRKLANKSFKRNLKREFQYDIRLLKLWIDKIEEILRKISVKDKQINQYLKYSDFARYFMDESFKFGLIYNLFNNDEVFNLNKLVTHCSLGVEQYVNNKVLEWNKSLDDEKNENQKETLKVFEFQKDQLKKFKEILENLSEKLKK